MIYYCIISFICEFIPPTGDGYLVGMNACVETGRVQEALDLLTAMRNSGLRPGHGAYNIIIKHWCNIGEESERGVYTREYALRPTSSSDDDLI